jgi:succinyl-CoA synthetase beta subunit
VDLLEHEGKKLFADAGLPVLPSLVARTPEEARRAAEQLGPSICVKAQAKTGGRGKAGGIRVCRSAAEVEAAAADILAMTVRGHAVASLLVERAVDVARELYLAITVSREVRSPLLIFSREGGVDIEELAQRNPDAILRRPIDPLLGLLEYQVRDVVDAAAFGPDDPGGTGAGKALAAVCRTLWKLYRERDATLVEVNPLVLTRSGEVVCLDSKVTIDENAFFRHPEMVPEPPEDEREAMARAAGLAFVPLDGDIGVIGNGAGLVMSTIDQIESAGGKAADFCDIGGGARSEVAQAALEAMFAGPPIAAVLVNIFGGITRCEDVATGLVEAITAAGVDAPVVVRLDGNAAEEGHAVLEAAALPNLTIAPDPDEAVRLVVEIARKRETGVGTAEAALTGAVSVAAAAVEAGAAAAATEPGTTAPGVAEPPEGDA